MVRISQWGAVICLILLIFLCLLWEVWLAPIRLGGSWLALKALIATIPLRGLLHGRRYTFQWSSMFILLYFLEGVMRSWADAYPGKFYAILEIILSVLFFACAIFYAKYAAKPQGVAQVLS
jgi:uncharacterized membrane protein